MAAVAVGQIVWNNLPYIQVTGLLRYNDQYDGSNGMPNNGRNSDGDSMFTAWGPGTPGTLYVTFDDGHGFSTGRSCDGNIVLGKFQDGTYLNGTNLNCMTGYCAEATTNCPASWSDNRTWKTSGITYVVDPYHTASLYLWAYRQDNGGSYTGANPFLIRSLDGGVSWCNPHHSNSIESCSVATDTNGDVPAGSDTPTISSTRMVRPEFVQYEQSSSGSLNVDNNPNYLYVMGADSTDQNMYLARCARSVDCTQNGQWQFYVGPLGGDPANGDNWSSSDSSATIFLTFPNAAVQGRPKYINGYGYLWPVSLELTQALNSSYQWTTTFFYSPRITGPFTRITPGGMWWDDTVRPNFAELEMRSMSVRQSSPFSGSISLLNTGDFSLRNYANPALNQYSLFWRSIFLTATPPATQADRYHAFVTSQGAPYDTTLELLYTFDDWAVNGSSALVDKGPLGQANSTWDTTLTWSNKGVTTTTGSTSYMNTGYSKGLGDMTIMMATYPLSDVAGFGRIFMKKSSAFPYSDGMELFLNNAANTFNWAIQGGGVNNMSISGGVLHWIVLQRTGGSTLSAWVDSTSDTPGYTGTCSPGAIDTSPLYFNYTLAGDGGYRSAQTYAWFALSSSSLDTQRIRSYHAMAKQYLARRGLSLP
jgi:hypothetical protein